MSGRGKSGLEALSELQKIVSALNRFVSKGRVYRFLKEITLYNRMQGMPGLLEAASRVEQLLLEEGPDNIETELIQYSGKTGPEWLPLSVYWDVESAQVIVGDRLYRLEAHPTLAVAHTPPSDGWVEGEVVVPEDPLDPDSYKDKEKIYLITKSWPISYRVAAEQNVKGVIMAKPKAHPDAVPYMGVYLDAREAQKYSLPAVALSWREAQQLAGKTVRYRVDSTIGGPSKIPVLTAWIGDRNSRGPVIMGHLCHPMPGANDNASGASSSLEAFISIAEAVDQGAISSPNQTIRLLLIPEWTGTVMSLEGWLGPLATAGVNLDMVGGRDPYTGPANIYYPPGTAPEHRLADIMVWTSRIANLGFPLKYYMFGSDHDVFTVYGIESEIVNQWPDPFYHSDLDDADKIDPERLRRAALLGASAAFAYAEDLTVPSNPAEEIVFSIVAKHVSKSDMTAAKLAGYYLAYKYGVARLSGPPRDWRPPARDERIRIEKGMKLATSIGIARIHGLQAAIRFERMSEKWSELNNIIRGEMFFASYREIPLGGYLTLIASVYGVDDMKKTVETLNELQDMGLIDVS